MRSPKLLTISNIPEISAIYFALLQCGYDCYTTGRSQEQYEAVRTAAGTAAVPPFFSGVRQNTCEAYPYWPRGAILETASFGLLPDHSRFRDFDAFYERVMSAGNLTDDERDQHFWDWVAGFPAALSEVMASEAFWRYLEWENSWIERQNAKYKTELCLIQSCLNVCVSEYDSTVQDIQVVINPIKCIYSADYHLNGNCFIYSAGALQIRSVIHEFLHHVVHPVVVENADIVAAKKTVYQDIDDSYYLSGDDAGRLNAFEEYAVRGLTEAVLTGNYPKSVKGYLESL